MNTWMTGKKFIETLLPEKEDFYSHVNMEDITNADYAQAKRVCKDFEMKNWGEYRDLYFQSNKLLLADLFENFLNICLKIYEFDPAKSLSAPRLIWQEALKITKVKLDLLTDISMLLMVENILEEEYATLFIDMQKLIKNLRKIMIKIKNRYILNIGM